MISRLRLFTTRPGLAPAGDLLSLASPRESKQREGEPQSGPLRGSLRCSCQVGSGSNSASPQTIARPFPPAPALLSPARTAGEKNRERGAGRALRVLRSWYFSRLPRPGWAEQRRRGRIKISDVRRLRSRQVSEISVHSEQRKVPVAQRRDPDCGSPFLWLLLLAKQKKVTSRRATPGRVVKGNSYQFNSNPCPSILDQMPVFPPAPSANHRHECRTQRPSA